MGEIIRITFAAAAANISGFIALAPTSQEIRSSSPSDKTDLASEEKEEEVDEIDELDREPEVERPRLSLPIQEEVDANDAEDEESSPEMRPPRFSLTMDEMADLTQRSYEFPRRVAMEDRDRGRLSMMSYAGGRLSENIAESSRLDETVQEEDPEVRDETVISQGAFDRG